MLVRAAATETLDLAKKNVPGLLGDLSLFGLESGATQSVCD